MEFRSGSRSCSKTLLSQVWLWVWKATEKEILTPNQSRCAAGERKKEWLPFPLILRKHLATTAVPGKCLRSMWSGCHVALCLCPKVHMSLIFKQSFRLGSN